MGNKHKEITVIFENLGNVYGYFQGLHDSALLHINSVLDDNTQEKLIEIGKTAANSGEVFQWLQLE